jgi:hypothetical protein
MSIGAGSLALSRLQVLAVPGQWKPRDIVARLREHAIVPIGVDDATEESMGWCHPHTGEPDFEDAADWLVGDSLIFGLRMDSKKVPGTLYRLQLRQLMGALQETRGDRGTKSDQDGGGSLRDRRDSSRRLRERAKERVKLELLKRTLPNIRLTEVVWQLQTNEIWLISASPAVFQAFDACFVRTFALPYAFRTPGTYGLDFDRILHGLPGADDDIERLVQAVPWGAFGVPTPDEPGHVSKENENDAPF